MSPKSAPEKEAPKSVFVISPIGSPGSLVSKNAAYALKYIFRRALQAPEWEVSRADEGKLSDSIGQHVIRSIVESDLIIADLTGHNPNVFYELAVAHGFRKPVVHLISTGESLPFDVFDQRTIHYDITDLESVESAVDSLREFAVAALDNDSDLVTPLTNYDAFATIRKGTDSESGDAVVDVLEQVLARLTSLEGRVAPPKYTYVSDEGRVQIRPSKIHSSPSIDVRDLIDYTKPKNSPFSDESVTISNIRVGQKLSPISDPDDKG